MSNKTVRKPLSIVLGAAVVTGLGAAGVANAEAEEGLFDMEELTSGYLIAGAHEGGGDDSGEEGDGEDKGGEGKCGEGKCGEGKCGSA
jgi:uncharacterized low-complexity protein